MLSLVIGVLEIIMRSYNWEKEYNIFFWGGLSFEATPFLN